MTIDGGSLNTNDATSPVYAATIEVMVGLLSMLEGIEDKGDEPEGTSPSHVRAFIHHAMERNDIPLDKLSRWLGYVQGVMTARGLLDVEAERDRTRPIFHAAYEAASIARPATIHLPKENGPREAKPAPELGG